MNLYVETIGSGEPLVLLNGVMMTTASWAAQVAALSKHFQCILHDFRGQLRSDRPPAPFSMSLHVDDLAALLDRLSIDAVHVVGTSYGAEVGMMFAAAHPGRVRSLSVIAATATVDDAMREGVRQWSDTARHAPQELWNVTVARNYSRGFIQSNPALIAAAKARVDALPKEWFDALADLCDAFERLDIDLTAIKAPTLVIAAEDDAVKPVACSGEISRAIPGARLKVIPGAGHAVIIEKPQEVNAALLEFLLAARTRPAEVTGRKR
jgi:3-oxoadipate enol-lactonase